MYGEQNTEHRHILSLTDVVQFKKFKMPRVNREGNVGKEDAVWELVGYFSAAKFERERSY